MRRQGEERIKHYIKLSQIYLNEFSETEVIQFLQIFESVNFISNDDNSNNINSYVLIHRYYF